MPRQLGHEILDVGEYTATEKFRSIERHTCVCKRDGSLVAVTGPADDADAINYAILFARAPILREALQAIADPEHCLTRHTVDGLRRIARGVVDELRVALGEKVEAAHV